MAPEHRHEGLDKLLALAILFSLVATLHHGGPQDRGLEPMRDAPAASVPRPSPGALGGLVPFPVEGSSLYEAAALRRAAPAWPSSPPRRLTPDLPPGTPLDAIVLRLRAVLGWGRLARLIEDSPRWRERRPSFRGPGVPIDSPPRLERPAREGRAA